MIRSPLTRAGFTLVECLAVIAIIGVLVGLLLPAVQSARESARAISCKNNLIQVHLAVQGYHSAFDVFPAGTVTQRLPARLYPDGKDHSWMVQIRPFLDGGFALAEKWSPAHSSYHPRNWPLVGLGSDAFYCPSSPILHSDDRPAHCYAGVHDGRDEPIDANSRGFFVANRFLRSQDVADGMSHTLQVGEILPRYVETSFRWVAGNQSTLRTTSPNIDEYAKGNEYDYWSQMTYLSRPYGFFRDPPKIDFVTLSMACDQDGPSAEPEIVMETIVNRLEELIDELDAQNGGPTAQPFGGEKSNIHPQFEVPYFTIPTVGPKSERPLGFASFHHDRMNAVFADGRVETVSRFIDGKLYSQIGVRDDHSPLAKPLAD
ncbi:MAG: DUF1559 domain-containing protein [Pirellulales bacterium]|nr:DUF1559 domain-containing protein [Pirellulales bacterium]